MLTFKKVETKCGSTDIVHNSTNLVRIFADAAYILGKFFDSAPLSESIIVSLSYFKTQTAPLLSKNPL
jgi:hypothetical protein